MQFSQKNKQQQQNIGAIWLNEDLLLTEQIIHEIMSHLKKE